MKVNLLMEFDYYLKQVMQQELAINMLNKQRYVIRPFLSMDAEQTVLLDYMSHVNAVGNPLIYSHFFPHYEQIVSVEQLLNIEPEVFATIKSKRLERESVEKVSEQGMIDFYNALLNYIYMYKAGKEAWEKILATNPLQAIYQLHQIASQQVNRLIATEIKDHKELSTLNIPRLCSQSALGEQGDLAHEMFNLPFELQEGVLPFNLEQGRLWDTLERERSNRPEPPLKFKITGVDLLKSFATDYELGTESYEKYIDLNFHQVASYIDNLHECDQLEAELLEVAQIYHDAHPEIAQRKHETDHRLARMLPQEEIVAPLEWEKFTSLAQLSSLVKSQTDVEALTKLEQQIKSHLSDKDSIAGEIFSHENSLINFYLSLNEQQRDTFAVIESDLKLADYFETSSSLHEVDLGQFADQVDIDYLRNFGPMGNRKTKNHHLVDLTEDEVDFSWDKYANELRAIHKDHEFQFALLTRIHTLRALENNATVAEIVTSYKELAPLILSQPQVEKIFTFELPRSKRLKRLFSLRATKAYLADLLEPKYLQFLQVCLEHYGVLAHFQQELWKLADEQKYDFVEEILRSNLEADPELYREVFIINEGNRRRISSSLKPRTIIKRRINLQGKESAPLMSVLPGLEMFEANTQSLNYHLMHRYSTYRFNNRQFISQANNGSHIALGTLINDLVLVNRDDYLLTFEKVLCSYTFKAGSSYRAGQIGLKDLITHHLIQLGDSLGRLLAPKYFPITEPVNIVQSYETNGIRVQRRTRVSDGHYKTNPHINLLEFLDGVMQATHLHRSYYRVNFARQGYGLVVEAQDSLNGEQVATTHWLANFEGMLSIDYVKKPATGLQMRSLMQRLDQVISSLTESKPHVLQPEVVRLIHEVVRMKQRETPQEFESEVSLATVNSLSKANNVPVGFEQILQHRVQDKRIKVREPQINEELPEIGSELYELLLDTDDEEILQVVDPEKLKLMQLLRKRREQVERGEIAGYRPDGTIIKPRGRPKGIKNKPMPIGIRIRLNPKEPYEK